MITIDVLSVQVSDSTGATNWIDINVQDDGAGMSEDTRRQALDPFFTMKEAGMGNGMGLSQVQEFALQCGGRIDIFSRPDQGTAVRIRLPSENNAAPAEDDMTIQAELHGG